MTGANHTRRLRERTMTTPAAVASFGAPRNIGPGIYRWGGMLWTVARARKAGICVMSGQAFAPGEETYLPITNNLHRMMRVRRDAMENR